VKKPPVWMSLVALLTAALFTAGCGTRMTGGYEIETSADNTRYPSVITDAGTFNFSSAKTVGNRTFIPLNVRGEPAKSENVRLILDVLNEFEKAYPNLKVTDWKIEKQQYTVSAPPIIFGIWITHEPKRPARGPENKPE